jgi:hypothetical protein
MGQIIYISYSPHEIDQKLGFLNLTFSGLQFFFLHGCWQKNKIYLHTTFFENTVLKLFRAAQTFYHSSVNFCVRTKCFFKLGKLVEAICKLFFTISVQLLYVWVKFPNFGYADCYSKGPGFESRVTWSFSEGLALDWQFSLVKNKTCLEWPICGVGKVTNWETSLKNCRTARAIGFFFFI